MLTENNPNRRMTLVRNPNFRGEIFPGEGEPGDAEHGYLMDAGARMPFIDEFRFMLEKEDIPEWNKFLQGYYDSSAIAPDGFDQAIRFDAEGRPELTPLMADRNISLSVATQMSVSYVGFNMLDPIIGGTNERARLVRRALSIAVDMEEMISIFGNGRGVPAQGPLPPGIFGYRSGQEGINPVVYEWKAGRAQRRGVDVARALLSEAGYPGGIDPATGSPLVLHFDATASGPDMKSLFNWYRKQFAKVGIELVIRSTDYNRFQDKMKKGQAQIFSWGWNADYPDPENFLFLLYGPNGKATFNGENAANYANPEFDALFQRMRGLPDGVARQRVIDQMMDLVRLDAPWIWGFHAQAYSLQHAWVHNTKPNLMARNTMKYRNLDPASRVTMQRAWNQPGIGILCGMLMVLIACMIPAVIGQRRRRRATAL
jgi:ABC-type transport system substrate-binding protein